MHDYIFQLSAEPVRERINDLIHENVLRSMDIDYVSNLDETGYDHAVDLLWHLLLKPTNLFERYNDPCHADSVVFRFVGNLCDFRKSWMDEVSRTVNSIRDGSCSDADKLEASFRQLEAIVCRPFNRYSESLFYPYPMCDDRFDFVTQSDLLADIVNHMKSGDLLYLGGILNYHK